MLKMDLSLLLRIGQNIGLQFNFNFPMVTDMQYSQIIGRRYYEMGDKVGAYMST